MQIPIAIVLLVAYTRFERKIQDDFLSVAASRARLIAKLKSLRTALIVYVVVASLFFVHTSFAVARLSEADLLHPYKPFMIASSTFPLH